MLDFIGQSIKIWVFNFKVYFSRSDMYHMCHSDINFSVNVKCYKVIDTTSQRKNKNPMYSIHIIFIIDFVSNSVYENLMLFLTW
jgi:hypothetical protein